VKNNPKGLKNMIGGRRRDFRQHGRCISWESNTGLKSKFDRRIFEEIAAHSKALQEGSTRDLVDLTTAEVDRIKNEIHAENDQKDKQPPKTHPAIPKHGSQPAMDSEVSDGGNLLLRGDDLIQWPASQ
jgi:hypothetical protein